jgi:hypothetical protein
MTAAEFKARVLPSLLAGTGRRPIAWEGAAAGDAAKAPLQALSLTGQALRFERPPAPESYAAPALVRDERRMVADGVRRPLIRLLTTAKATADLELAVAYALDRLQLRLHPFDMPRLDGFVRSHAEQLGATAEYWALRKSDAGAPTASYFFGEDLDDANWSAATPRRRALYIEERRRRDADAARGLVETAWGQQDPDARVKLLAALETGLGPPDQAFLEGLAKDRSPRVQAAAARMLSRQFNSEHENPALRLCMERIKRTESGVLRKRVVLALELPANVKEAAAPAWIRGLFADVGWGEFARTLKMTEGEVIEAGKKDANLLLGLAWTATQDARMDLLNAVCEALPDAWERMSGGGAVELEHFSREQRLQCAEALTRTVSAKPPMNYPMWSWLHRAVEGALPAGLMQGMLRSKWAEVLEEKAHSGPHWPEMLAACCPAQVRPALREQLRDIDPALTATAISWMDILDTLEKQP